MPWYRTLVAPALALDRRKVRAQAEARFSYQAMVDAYLELYGKMTDKTASKF